jgi:ubiquinol-cytochrome c reductase cytochrome b subunit
MRSKYNNFLKLIYRTFLLYPTPINLNYLWNFGSLALYGLIIQIISGILLAFWYIPSIDLAFFSVEYIVREVEYGWLFRNLHANGASFFFFVVYVHMARSIYYGSYVYPREKVWYTGAIIFILMIATAFFGYILPFGQMSYWAATVISSLTSVIPFIGKNILLFLWGGISIEQPTLSRIYAAHFLFPFIIFVLVITHLVFLHEHGSNNPLGIKIYDFVPFHPYYTIKDIVTLIVSTIVYLIFVFYLPNYTMHSDNYIMANPDVTPTHIVPEWYFLPFYGVLRSVPSKVGGVLLLALALLLLVLFPLISYPLLRSGTFRPVFQIIFWVFVGSWLLLGWSGGNPISTPYYEICQISTILYFLFFLVLNPLNNYFEWLVYEYYLMKGISSLEIIENKDDDNNDDDI